DVRAAGGLVLPTKTTGPTLTATIVIDVTGDSDKGRTSIRAQKASTSTAAIFTSSIISGWQGGCLATGYTDIQASTDGRFIGIMNGWVDVPGVLSALLVPLGYSTDAANNHAAITGTDYAACTSVNGRQILSFTAVIQYGFLPGQ